MMRRLFIDEEGFDVAAVVGEQYGTVAAQRF